MPDAATPPLTRRPIHDDDLPFLSRLYASTRETELAATPWPAEEKQSFLAQQFQAQHTFYTGQFAGAEFSLLLIGAEPAGRLYLDRREDEIRIIDIALLPAHRGKGIGTLLLREVMAEATDRGVPVTIHVERFNRALTLYRRLGFEAVEEQGPYILMAWTPRRQESAR